MNPSRAAFGLQFVFLSLILAASAYGACSPAPPGLVGWWQGESNKINAVDGDPGVPWGSPAFAQGMVGSGFFFVGTDPVLLGNPSNLHLQDFTIETWVKRVSPTIATLDNGNVYGSILSWGDGGYVFNLLNDGRFGIKKAGVADIFSDGVLSSSLRVTDTNFHHVAVTKSGSKVVYYLDGTNEVAGPYDPGFTFGSTLAIGAGWITSLRSFYGTVDELSVYNRALSPAEINLLYASGAMGKCATAPACLQPLSNPMVVVGSNAVLSAPVAGAQPISQQWFFGGLPLVDNGHISGSTSTLLTISNAQTNDIGDYFLIGSNAVGVCTSTVAHISVGLPPAVLQAPSSQTNFIGSNSVFSVISSGNAPLSYRWRFNGNYLTNDSRISGVSEAALSISNTAIADIGSYDVVVANGYGSVTSAVATLFVVSFQPVILSDPTNRAALYGAVTTFAATVSGIPELFYQWRKTGVPLVDGERVSGSERVALTITDIQFEDAGDYQLVVSNAFGVTASANANLGVLPFVIWGASGEIPPSALTNTIALSSSGGQYGNLTVCLKSDGTVAGWGHYYDGYTTHIFTQADIPPEATNVVAIAAGADHGLARRSDGSVVGLGNNYSGQATVPAGAVPAAGIATSESYSMVLKSNGTVAAWGYLYGVGSPPPVLSNVVVLAAGSGHALALRENGTVTAWGTDYYGERDVPAGLSNVVAIAAGAAHSLALRSDGMVVAWGGSSQYGEGIVPAGLSNVVSIVAEWFYSLALKSDGTVVGWGRNDVGQATPPAGLTNVVAIGGAYNRSSALLQTPAAQAPPTIWWQGSTNRVLLVGQTTVFVPSITGSLPMAFQWYFNNTGLSEQTNRWLVLSSAQTNQSGNYFLVVSNLAGSVTSAVANVQIGFSPLVVQQPLSATNITGGTVQFNASVSGSEPLTYRWYRNSTALADDARHFGAATPGLTISNLLTSDAGSYTLHVTSPFGSVTGAVANLTVYIPPSLNVQPASATVLGGVSFYLTASATGTPPLRYQWVKDGTNLLGATSSFLLISHARRTNSGSYFVVVTNPGGVATSSNAIVKVHVPQRLAVTLQSGGQVILSSQDSDGGLLSATDLSSFHLLGSSNLYNWQAISNALTYTNGTLQFTDPFSSSNAAYFYRVVEFW